jgi:phage-related protein
MPHSRPLPSIGHRCHDLRLTDANKTGRIIYCMDTDTIVILEVFDKTTNKTPQSVINICKERIRQYDQL